MTFTLQFYLSGAWQTMNCQGLGIMPGEISEKHLLEYYFKFKHRGHYDEQTYPHQTPVRIYTKERDDPAPLGAQHLRFLGMITKANRHAQIQGEGIEYQCDSWWYAASRFTVKLSGIPRVVYNARVDDPQHDPTRYKMTVGEILTDLANLISADLAAWTTTHFLTAWGGINLVDTLDTVPPKLVLDAAFFSQAIATVLQWMPDVYLRIDRATGAFNFHRKASGAVHSLALNDWTSPDKYVDTPGMRLNPRLDLCIPRIVLSFPQRTEYYECYIDHDLVADTPDDLLGIPETITALDDLRFQLSHHPIHEIIELGGGGDYRPSEPSGIIAFREHPSSFYIRYIAEGAPYIYDTGYGGTAYTDYGVEDPVLERYLADFPILNRCFYLQGVDPADAAWLLSFPVGETYPDPLHWPALIGQAVSIAGKGASTIAEIAVHNFNFSGGGGVISYNAVGIRLAAAIPGAAQGDPVSIQTENATAAVTALADSFWKALRDVPWEGELPAFKWMPQLELGARVNLLNTAEPKLATMAEPIQQLSFLPGDGKTTITLNNNPRMDFTTLLLVVSELLDPENFIQGTGARSFGGGGSDMKAHKHNATGAQNGGDELNPKYFYMGAGVVKAENEIRYYPNGVRIYRDTGIETILCGDPTGSCAYLSKNGLHIVVGGKHLYLGNIGGQLGFTIDGNEYLFTNGTTRLLGSRIE